MKFQNHLRILKWRLLGSKKPANMFRKQQIITRLQKKTGIKVFVETGTFRGDMTVAQHKYFEKLFTIELGYDLYLKAQKRFEAFPNIKGLFGNSSEVMHKIIDEINEPAIFWLDGHYSGGITAKGDLVCPIFGELDAIFRKRGIKHVLCIDDARLFDGTNDYPTVQQVKDYFLLKGVEYSFNIVDDIMIILLL